jgi:hypothetical protein
VNGTGARNRKPSLKKLLVRLNVLTKWSLTGHLKRLGDTTWYEEDFLS